MNMVLIESDPSPMKLEVLMVEDWPLKQEPVGIRQEEYANTETSYIISGQGQIDIDEGETVEFKEGDLITVMPETRCTWHITEAVERYYANG